MQQNIVNSKCFDKWFSSFSNQVPPYKIFDLQALIEIKPGQKRISMKFQCTNAIFVIAQWKRMEWNGISVHI